MLAFIPILGPIVQGVTSVWSKYIDRDLAKIKDDSERIKLQHELTMSSTSKANADLQRDLLCFPVIIWTNMVIWDSIVVKNWKHLMINPVELPYPVSLLPIAVLCYLFGNAWLNRK